jgi:hypothetical protein
MYSKQIQEGEKKSFHEDGWLMEIVMGRVWLLTLYSDFFLNTIINLPKIKIAMA